MRVRRARAKICDPWICDRLHILHSQKQFVFVACVRFNVRLPLSFFVFSFQFCFWRSRSIFCVACVCIRFVWLFARLNAFSFQIFVRMFCLLWAFFSRLVRATSHRFGVVGIWRMESVPKSQQPLCAYISYMNINEQLTMFCSSACGWMCSHAKRMGIWWNVLHHQCLF